jgi:hypothetical protein
MPGKRSSFPILDFRFAILDWRKKAAGWRMASTAMRLAILAAREGTFFALIDGPYFDRSLP